MPGFFIWYLNWLAALQFRILYFVQVSLNNYNALVDFFKKFPEYQINEFFITGESYAGVYNPTLSVRILQGSFKINFKVCHFLPSYCNSGLLELDFKDAFARELNLSLVFYSESLIIRSKYSKLFCFRIYGLFYLLLKFHVLTVLLVLLIRSTSISAAQWSNFVSSL